MPGGAQSQFEASYLILTSLNIQRSNHMGLGKENVGYRAEESSASNDPVPQAA